MLAIKDIVDKFEVSRAAEAAAATGTAAAATTV